jgi:hypothetical protein
MTPRIHRHDLAGSEPAWIWENVKGWLCVGKVGSVIGIELADAGEGALAKGNHKTYRRHLRYCQGTIDTVAATVCSDSIANLDAKRKGPS